MARCLGAIVAVSGAIGLGFGVTNHAFAQVQLPPARAPCSVLSGLPCHPSFCGIFHRGPCFPQYLPPIGEDLRLTVTSTDENDGSNSGAAGNSPDKAAAGNNADADELPLDSLGAMYAALRACWVPPPKDEARHGMQYTVRFSFKRDGDMVAPPRVTYASHDAPNQVRDAYRDAVDAALKRCLPLHFSKGLGAAVTGRPIAIRFVEDRTIDNGNPQ
jgi:hypothetical protein